MEKISNGKMHLPKGWKWVKLGDLVDNPKQDLVDGPFGSNLKAEEYQESGIPVFKIQNIKVNRFVDKKISYISEEKAKSLSRHSFKAGDLIITKLGEPLGLCCKVPEKYPFGVIVADLMRLRPSKTKVYDQYLIYAINSEIVQNQFKTITKGTTRARVNLGIVRDIEVAIPSIDEQHAIVSKIEELLSELDKGKQQLELAQQQLKVYRQAVLKWAFEGKLTNKDVREGELPEGWSLVRVKDVAETYGGYAFKSSEFEKDGKYQVLRMGNVRPGLLRYYESPVYLKNVEESVLKKSLLKLNDIIITQTGTRKKRDYGFTALIPKENLLLNQRIAAIRCLEKYSPKFFLYFSWTDSFKDQFFANETGNVGQGNVGMKAVTETLVPFCSPEEQNQIVQEIENRLSVCDKVEETINQSLAQAETLRQSILKKAFEGKLI